MQSKIEKRLNRKTNLKHSQKGYRTSTYTIGDIMQNKANAGDKNAQEFLNVVKELNLTV